MASIVRFLIGSSLVMVGSMVGLSAAITVVGLPIGVILVGMGLQMMVGRSDSQRPKASTGEAR